MDIVPIAAVFAIQVVAVHEFGGWRGTLLTLVVWCLMPYGPRAKALS